MCDGNQSGVTSGVGDGRWLSYGDGDGGCDYLVINTGDLGKL